MPYGKCSKFETKYFQFDPDLFFDLSVESVSRRLSFFDPPAGQTYLARPGVAISLNSLNEQSLEPGPSLFPEKNRDDSLKMAGFASFRNPSQSLFETKKTWTQILAGQ